MLRNIAGIVIGYLMFAVPAFLLFRLTNHDPHAPATLKFEVFAIAYGILFALLGGYVGTAISGKSALWVPFSIAAILAAAALSSLITTGLSWSPVSALLCMAPAAVTGGFLRILQQRMRQQKD